MNHYITSTVIKNLREKQGMTQAALAQKLCVSDKTVSKWESGRGLPDITLVEPLAQALRVSVPELLSGELMCNENRAANLRRAKLYVCPLCGNVLHATGNALVSCCGITLPPLEAEEPDGGHTAQWELSENDFYVTLSHPMTKEHFISFLAYRTDSRFELVKCYPEGSCEARFQNRGPGMLLWYCNRHGLFGQPISGRKRT